LAALLEEARLDQGQQVRSCCLMGPAVARRMGLERVDRVRYAQAICEQRELPVVELARVLQQRFDVANILDLLP
jgi:hypothetical protein